MSQSNFRYYGSSIVIILIFVTLAALYSRAVPPFESPDEYYHFASIVAIARTGQLPPTDLPPAVIDFGPEPDHPWRHTAFHAPLYYWAAAELIQGQDLSGFERYRLNPHAEIGVAGAESNVNFIAHVPGNPTDSAIRIVRLFSIGLGAITIACVGGFAAELSRRKSVAVLAMLVCAVLPQFIFISGTINNDNLVITLSAFILFLTARYLHRPMTLAGIVGLAAALALASLAKASAITLYPLVGAALLVMFWKRQLSRRQFWGAVVMIAALWALMAGWWYWRNLTLFHDLTATSMVAKAAGLRSDAPGMGEMIGLYESFWGLFGWFNIVLPITFYRVTLLLLALASLGLLRLAVRLPRAARLIRLETGLFAAYGAVFLVSWWRYNLMVRAAQGRILFPLLPVIALLIALGIHALPRLLKIAGFGLVGGVMLFAFVIPQSVIAPKYAPDLSIKAEDWQPPSESVPFTIREPWQNDPCLNVWVEPAAVSDGRDSILVPVYFEATCPVSGYWSLFGHLIDMDTFTCIAGDTQYILSQTDTTPQGGRLPFPAFEPGLIVADTLVIPIPEDRQAESSFDVQIGLYDAGGTFMRAFVAGAGTDTIHVGTCSPETIVLHVQGRPSS